MKLYEKKKTFSRTKPVFYFHRIYFLSQTTSAGGVAVHRLAQKIMSTRKNGCARETREGRSLPRVSLPCTPVFSCTHSKRLLRGKQEPSMALGRKTIVHFTGTPKHLNPTFEKKYDLLELVYLLIIESISKIRNFEDNFQLK